VRVPLILTLLLCTVLLLVPSFVALRLGGDLVPLAVAVLPTWATVLAKIAYDRWDPLYFWVNRAWMWALNREVRWGLEAEWSEYDTLGTTLADLVNQVRTAVPRTVLRQDDTAQKILECTHSGYSVVIAQVADPGDTLLMQGNGNIVVRLLISEMVVPFRFADRLLDSELVPLLSAIHKRLAAGNEKYSVKVSFLGENPYFGFYLRRLGLRQIRHFDCEFVDNRAGRNVVSVGRQSLSINSPDLTTIASLTKKYLALSPPG